VLASKYANSSRGQLKALVTKAIDEEADPIEFVNERLDDWEVKRPDKVGEQESNGGVYGLSLFLWFAVGMYAQWTTVGKSCPFCVQLDGKRVFQGSYFLNAGDSLAGDDHNLTMSGNIMHPPLHQGCDCVLIPIGG